MPNTLNDMIEYHVNLWLEWVVHDNNSKNQSLDMKTRRHAAEMCEKIVYEKYKSMRRMDEYFDKLIEENK